MNEEDVARLAKKLLAGDVCGTCKYERYRRCFSNRCRGETVIENHCDLWEKVDE